MGQEWINKADQYPPPRAFFEVWDDEHRRLIPYCYLRINTKAVASSDRNWSGTWTYWREVTKAPNSQ